MHEQDECGREKERHSDLSGTRHKTNTTVFGVCLPLCPGRSGSKGACVKCPCGHTLVPATKTRTAHTVPDITFWTQSPFFSAEWTSLVSFPGS